ncbi:hypothetical protein PCANC_07725 [Puccinia coronata f. sp. avenae]|uniref:Uncharacterized protein n=1 Tax=Puccinia coronata f. sp. avenae TaxID=200324 RepID=A0A2N5VRC0_9BASI|nr:hypothetical protein PCANC_07725 [Puccinia coronata f. sp. avenae]
MYDFLSLPVFKEGCVRLCDIEDSAVPTHSAEILSQAAQHITQLLQPTTITKDQLSCPDLCLKPQLHQRPIIHASFNSTTTHPALSRSQLSLSLVSLPGPTAAAREAHERRGEMRSNHWIAYAAQTFVICFWHFISKANWAYIFIMLITYMLMHLTFNFPAWNPDQPHHLSEALPFLVITVGLNKPYVLAHAILTRSHWSASPTV